MLATTGGAGALAGSGTSALFTDEETFTDNGLRASTSVAGVVDIDVTATAPDDSTVDYEVAVPDDGNTNPVYLWLRAGCPEHPELACATDLELRVDCESGPIASGPARDVLDRLRNGTQLCGGQNPCLQPGETRTVTAEVTGQPGTGYDGPEGPLAFDLEFYGAQCRYDRGAENPFAERDSCPSCEPATGTQEVSWITFCIKGSGSESPPDPAPTAGTELVENGTAVHWETEEPVDYVVLKTGLGGPNEPYTVYDYRSEDRTSGVARVGDTGADFRGTRDASEFTGCPDSGGQPDSCPCQYAKDVIEGQNGEFQGTSTKLEEVGGELSTEGSDQ